MKPNYSICIIDAGFPKDSIDVNRLNALAGELRAKGGLIEIHTLLDKHIIPCTGCWGCWVKTPGECLFNDDTVVLREAIIQSDLVIFASPLSMGYPVAKMKHLMDKLIPLILPYIELVQGENHHAKRYENYPEIGFLYGAEADTDREDLEILKDMLSRFALNFKSKLTQFNNISEPLDVLSEQSTPLGNLNIA